MLVQIFKTLRQKVPTVIWGIFLALLVHIPFLFIFREHLKCQQNNSEKIKKTAIPVRVIFSEKSLLSAQTLIKTDNFWCTESEIGFSALSKIPPVQEKTDLGEYPGVVNIQENLPNQEVILEKHDLFLEKSYCPIEIYSFDLPANRALILPPNDILKPRTPGFFVETEIYTFEVLFDNYSGKILTLNQISSTSDSISSEVLSILSSVSINPVQEFSTIQCTLQITYRSEKSSD